MVSKSWFPKTGFPCTKLPTRLQAAVGMQQLHEHLVRSENSAGAHRYLPSITLRSTKWPTCLQTDVGLQQVHEHFVCSETGAVASNLGYFVEYKSWAKHKKKQKKVAAVLSAERVVMEVRNMDQTFHETGKSWKSRFFDFCKNELSIH